MLGDSIAAGSSYFVNCMHNTLEFLSVRYEMIILLFSPQMWPDLQNVSSTSCIHQISKRAADF